MKHFQFLFYFKVVVYLIGLSINCTAVELNTTNECIKVYSNKYTTEFNVNAMTPFEEYKQTNNRNLSSYENHLGSAFKRSVSLLKANDYYIDVGVGYGLAGLELISKKSDIHIVAINAQNAWAFVEKIPGKGTDNNVSPVADPWAKQSDIYSQILKQIGGETNALRLAGALGVSNDAFQYTQGMSIGPDGYDRPYFTYGFARDVLEHIRDSYNSKMLSGYEYKVGFAENILPTLKKKAKLITDLFGAYFYSIDRPKIISEYYSNLLPGGEAYIIIESRDIHERGDQTYGPKTFIEGTQKSIEEYLCTTYPNIFSIHTHERRGLANSDIKYLKINKPMTADLINLNFSVVSFLYNENDPVHINRQIPIVNIRRR